MVNSFECFLKVDKKSINKIIFIKIQNQIAFKKIVYILSKTRKSENTYIFQHRWDDN